MLSLIIGKVTGKSLADYLTPRLFEPLLDDFEANVFAAAPTLPCLLYTSSTAARLKLKGIDGGPHKQWSMWFNSKQREEPYQVLPSDAYLRD